MSESGFAPLPSRPVTPAALAKWRDSVQAAVMSIGRVRLEMAAKYGMRTPENDALIKTQESLRQVSEGLHDAAPVSVQVAPDRGSHDLGSLASLDTPNARALLMALEKAQQLAEAVDLERGNVISDDVPLFPSETRGTDIAEAVAIIAARLRDDVHGAQGKE